MFYISEHKFKKLIVFEFVVGNSGKKKASLRSKIFIATFSIWLFPYGGGILPALGPKILYMLNVEQLKTEELAVCFFATQKNSTIDINMLQNHRSLHGN